MRRVLSVILFVLAGWILVSGVMMEWMDLGQGIGMRLTMLGVFCLFSAPFFLLAIWASPGRRLREFGLTVLISAAIGGAMALMMMLLFNDPSFVKLMPPDQKMPDFKFRPLFGVAVTAIVGGLGWLLWRSSTAEDRRH